MNRPEVRNAVNDELREILRTQLTAPAADGRSRQTPSTTSTRQTIAAVNGATVGLGMDVALACDFIVAAPRATFVASYLHRGLIPDGGGLYFLPRRIGLQLAKDLISQDRGSLRIRPCASG